MVPVPKFEAVTRARRLRASMGVRASSQWRTLVIENCHIAVEEYPADQAPAAHPIVCLHAAGSGAREFRPLLENRPAGSRIILIDWPGHGRSGDCGVWNTNPISPIGNRAASDTSSSAGPSAVPSMDSVIDPRFTVKYCVQILHQVLNKLAVRRPILLGSGFGAAVAVRYAADHPSRVLALVLCQPAGIVPPGSVNRVSHQQNAWQRGLNRILPEPHDPSLNLASKRQRLRTDGLLPVMQPVIGQAGLSLRHSATNLRAALRALQCPVLFALSRDSREYRIKRYLALLEPLLASAPQHRLTAFQGGFHPLWDEPERFSQALTGFVQSMMPLDQHQHAWLLAAADWPAHDTNLWKCVHPGCGEERILPSGQNANQPRESSVSARASAVAPLPVSSPVSDSAPPLSGLQ